MLPRILSLGEDIKDPEDNIPTDSIRRSNIFLLLYSIITLESRSKRVAGAPGCQWKLRGYLVCSLLGSSLHSGCLQLLLRDKERIPTRQTEKPME